MIFKESLNIVLSEGNNNWRPMDAAMEIMRKMSAAKQLVSDLHHQLLSLKNRMNADLALSLKRHMPALNVSIGRNGECKIGYKSKHLVFTPNIEQGVWIVDSSDDRFKNRFSKAKRQTLIISPNLDRLISSITDFFTEHYKSLGEDISGVGVIIVEGRIGSLKDIVEWRDNVTLMPLQSRSVRKKCPLTD